MPGIFITVLLLGFAVAALVLLLRPSLFIRFANSPWQPDTPQNRVWARALGLYVCLFVLMTGSGGFPVFHRNIAIAAFVSPVLLPIVLWLLWKYSRLRQVMRQHLVDATTEDRRWERRMTLVFGGLLCTIVLIAVLA